MLDSPRSARILGLTGSIMTASATVVSFSAAIINTMGQVPTSTTEGGSAAIKKAGGAQSALSAFLRTGQKSTATIGALAHVWGGIRELLADGQKSKLLGFARTSKKDSAALNVLRTLGILTEGGNVPLDVGVEQGFKGSAADKGWGDHLPTFIGMVGVEADRLAGLAKAKREEAKATAEAEAEAEATAEAEAELSGGQLDNEAVNRIIARIAAGALSDENREALMLALYPFTDTE